ncbi:MAG: ATP-binding protein [Planctomycetota bacterium]
MAPTLSETSQSQNRPTPAASASGPVAIIWTLAVLLSFPLATLLPATLVAPAIIATAALATVLAGRARERARGRELTAVITRLDAIGDIADPRYNAPTRRGPVEESTAQATQTQQPTAGNAGSDSRQTSTNADDNTTDNLGRLDQHIATRRAHVDRQLTWYMQARAALRAIIDGIDAPVFATDERGHIRLVNRQGDRLFRRRTGRLAGLELEELFTQSALLELHTAAQDGVAGQQKVRIPVEGQPRVFEVSAVPVRMDIAHVPAQSPQRAGVVLTLRDVTELAQADQLKTDFVANASHELRTPITSIRLAVETLEGRGGADATMRTKSVAAIESNITRLEEMVSDLLDLSHLESPERTPKPEPISLSDLAGTLDTMFTAACEARSLALHFNFEPTLTHVNTDRGRLQLILRNLIDNASKFAFEGTAIEITAERTTAHQPTQEQTQPNNDDPTRDPPAVPDQPPVEPQRADTQTNAVRFRVRDRGIGIPLKHQQRVFERFYQVDESRTRQGARRGTGLGLAIVKHAVRSLGGDIAIESVWQQGTTITVVLPDDPARANDNA